MNKIARKNIIEKINHGIESMEKCIDVNSENVTRGGVQQYVAFTYEELQELKKALRG